MTRRNHDSVTEVSRVAVVDRFPPGTAQEIVTVAGYFLSPCAFAAIEDAASGRPEGMEMWARVARVLLARKPPGPLGLPEAQLDAWLEASWSAVAPRSDPAAADLALPVVEVHDVDGADGATTARMRAAIVAPLASPALGTMPGSRRESAREKFERRAANDPLGQTAYGRMPGMTDLSRAYDPRDRDDRADSRGRKR